MGFFFFTEHSHIKSSVECHEGTWGKEHLRNLHLLLASIGHLQKVFKEHLKLVFFFFLWVNLQAYYKKVIHLKDNFTFCTLTILIVKVYELSF